MDRFGPYVIEGELGGGAMGTVYRVRHAELGVHYALKVLKPQLFQAIDGLRFQREMQAMATVSSVPGVVKIHSAGVDEGRPYYVMDFVEGEDLRSLLKREGMLEQQRSVGFVLDLARTLAELHAGGLIHRDLKPANVIIDEHDKPRLADFGLSKAFADEASRLTATGEAIGTPLYMAPEQARGEPVGPPADVYALGMMLFLLVAGVPAVTGQTSVEILINANAGSHERLRSMAPRAPLALDELCHACFHSDPALRPSAYEVVTALEAFLASGVESEEQAQRAAAWPLAVCVLLLAGAGVAVAVSLRSGAEERGSSVKPAEVSAKWLEGALVQLARPEGIDPQLGQELAERSARVARESALGVRLTLLGGELALRRNELAGAREALEAARAVTPAGRDVRAAQQEAVWLEAVLVVAEGDPAGTGLSLVERAAELWKQRGYPVRADFASARVRLQLARGRYEAAARTLETAGPRLFTPELRCEVAIRSGHVAKAVELLPQVRRPALRARVRLAQAVAALGGGDTVSALALVRTEKVAAHPELARSLSRALSAAREGIYGWEGGLSKHRLTGVGREIAFHALGREVDPGYEMPAERVDRIEGKIFSVVSLTKGGSPPSRSEEMLSLLTEFVRLRPEKINAYTLFAKTLSKNLSEFLVPRPDRLEVLQQGREHARRVIERAKAADRTAFTTKQAREVYEVLTRWTGFGLHVLDREPELRRLVASETFASPQTRAGLANILVSRLMQRGESAEAEALLEKARSLAPDDLEVLYTVFFRQVERGQRSDAKETARKIGRLGLAPVGRRAGGLHARALSWLTFAEEEDGDLALAASAAYGVCGSFGQLIEFSVRYAQLQLRRRAPPATQAAILSAIDGVYVSYNLRNLPPPQHLKGLAKAGERGKLIEALNRIAKAFPAKPILSHPARY